MTIVHEIADENIIDESLIYKYIVEDVYLRKSPVMKFKHLKNVFIMTFILSLLWTTYSLL